MIYGSDITGKQNGTQQHLFKYHLSMFFTKHGHSSKVLRCGHHHNATLFLIHSSAVAVKIITVEDIILHLHLSGLRVEESNMV
jgi:hypothetical protein